MSKKEAIQEPIQEQPKVVKAVSAPEAPVYDPSKKYSWDNNAKFELTGHQFGLWLNSVRAKVSSPEAGEFHLAFESSAVIESIMAEGVKSGVIVELKE